MLEVLQNLSQTVLSIIENIQVFCVPIFHYFFILVVCKKRLQTSPNQINQVDFPLFYLSAVRWHPDSSIGSPFLRKSHQQFGRFAGCSQRRGTRTCRDRRQQHSRTIPGSKQRDIDFKLT